MVVVILVLVIAFFVFIAAAAVVLAIRSMSKDEKGRKAALASAPETLAGMFDGRDPVTYESTPRTLPFDVVTAAAIKAGYTLVGQAENPGERKTLVFTRTRPD